MVDNGELVSALTQRGVNGTNNTNFVNAQSVLGFEADVIVTEFINNGGIPIARIFGSFYNDGTYPEKAMGGDIHATVGIRHNGTQPVVFYNVARCKEDSCNLPSEYEFVYSYEDSTIPNLVGQPHRLSFPGMDPNSHLGSTTVPSRTIQRDLPGQWPS